MGGASVGIFWVLTSVSFASPQAESQVIASNIPSPMTMHLRMNREPVIAAARRVCTSNASADAR